MMKHRYVLPSHRRANEYLRRLAAAKCSVIESETPCDKWHDPRKRLDLVVLIDTSNSMRDEAVALSRLAQATVEAIVPPCEASLRVWWFGIEGTWPDTQFQQPYRAYLNHLGVADADILGRKRGTVINEGAQEDGARAIIDIARHFDWRSGSQRVILYLGDESLEGGNPKTTADIKAANEAITTAIEHKVKVFAYAGTGRNRTRPDAGVVDEYRNLTDRTNGQLYVAPRQNLRGLQADLEDLACADNEEMRQIQMPDVRPWIQLHWGDAPRDQLETDDLEILYLSVSNPYQNIVLRDVTIYLALALDRHKNEVDILPDGEPAIQIKPSRIIYFGDLPPYQAGQSLAETAVTRQVVMINRGARPGRYFVQVKHQLWYEATGYCDSDRFRLKFVAS